MILCREKKFCFPRNLAENIHSFIFGRQVVNGASPKQLKAKPAYILKSKLLLDIFLGSLYCCHFLEQLSQYATLLMLMVWCAEEG